MPVGGKIGKMRHRLRLETIAEGDDVLGGVTETPQLDASVWGSLTPVTGDEYQTDDTTETKFTHRIRIRYRADLSPKQRFKKGSRIFNIVAIRNVGERDRYQECDVVEEVIE